MRNLHKCLHFTLHPPNTAPQSVNSLKMPPFFSSMYYMKAVPWEIEMIHPFCHLIFSGQSKHQGKLQNYMEFTPEPQVIALIDVTMDFPKEILYFPPWLIAMCARSNHLWASW